MRLSPARRYAEAADFLKLPMFAAITRGDANKE